MCGSDFLLGFVSARESCRKLSPGLLSSYGKGDGMLPRYCTMGIRDKRISNFELSVYLYSVVIPCCTMATLGLPHRSSYDHPPPADPKPDPNSLKFAHTRAQLSAIARQVKPGDPYEGEPDADDLNRVPSTIVNKVVSLLVDEKEDELKALLKETYELDDETVSTHNIKVHFRSLMKHRSRNLCLT